MKYNMRYRQISDFERYTLLRDVMSSELPAKDFVSSAGDGLLFGAVVGYVIKKLHPY
jgi:hypothetical protein